MNDRDLIRILTAESLAQRSFKYRVDDLIKELPPGTTRSVLEDVRVRAHETDTALAHEADALDRYAGLER